MPAAGAGRGMSMGGHPALTAAATAADVNRLRRVEGKVAGVTESGVLALCAGTGGGGFSGTVAALVKDWPGIEGCLGEIGRGLDTGGGRRYGTGMCNAGVPNFPAKSNGNDNGEVTVSWDALSRLEQEFRSLLMELGTAQSIEDVRAIGQGMLLRWRVGSSPNPSQRAAAANGSTAP